MSLPSLRTSINLFLKAFEGMLSYVERAINGELNMEWCRIGLENMRIEPYLQIPGHFLQI
jgi:hypothetical protein